MRRELDVPRREEESSPHRPCAQVPATKKLTLSSTGAINASLCLAFPMRRERYRWRFEGLRARPMRRELLAYADRVVLLGQLMRADFARPERGIRHSMARTEVARDGPAATNSNPDFRPEISIQSLVRVAKSVDRAFEDPGVLNLVQQIEMTDDGRSGESIDVPCASMIAFATAA